MADGIEDFSVTEHAQIWLQRRGLDIEEIGRVLADPEQHYPVGIGREVFQSRIEMGIPPRAYLLRVFVDRAIGLPEVVTAYRTSKIDKYWRSTE